METQNNSKSDRKKAFIEKRKQLIAMSVIARTLVEQGEADTVNECLLAMYSEENEDITEFNTFQQWKQQGFTILKGSKAFLVWGQPRKVEQAKEGSEEPEEYKYWPVCYLFSNLQVEKPEAREQAQAQPEPTEQKETSDLPL